MATPLSAIGKHSGILMAVMCVLLMFAFVVADPLMQYANSGGGGSASRAGEVVATWDGGSINERQLDQAVVHRNILAAFQQTILQTGARDALAAGVEDLRPRLEPIPLPSTREQGVERDIVHNKVYAQRAREAGMVVSDQMIVEYLQAIGFDRVSKSQMRDVISRMNAGSGSKATISFVFDLLREAMLARTYIKSHSFAFSAILPEERWEDWKKVNELVVVEAAPLPIENFLDEVPEPSDAELKDFYEEYKDRIPNIDQRYGVQLPSGSPAFSLPPRVKVSYLKADFNAVVAQLEGEITDEQIAEYYEANKESFVAADRALFGDSSFFGDSGLLSEDPAATETEDAPAAEEETAADESPDDASESDAAPAEETAEEPAAEEASVDEAADAPAEEAATEPTEEPATDEEPATEEEEEEEEDDAADDSQAEADPATEAEDSTEYQPLEEVADEIRRRLAMDAAAERLQEKMDRVKQQLDDAYFKYFDAALEAKAKEAEEPTPPEALTNLQPIAEAEGLELVEVDQASQMELMDTVAGASVTTDPGAQVLPAWYVLFRTEDVEEFEPFLTRDVDGARYLILLTERYEGVTPEFEEARDQVTAAWRRSKAAEIALEKAEELAEKIGESGQSLEEYLQGMDQPLVSPDDVVETGEFSLFQIGPIAPTARDVPLRLSQPEPLVSPGPELLEGVFDLEPGKVGAEPNHDRSIVYLLRIAQQIGTEEELRANFLRDGDRWFGSSSMRQARAQNKLMALIGNLLEESGLEWARDPDRVM